MGKNSRFLNSACGLCSVVLFSFIWSHSLLFSQNPEFSPGFHIDPGVDFDGCIILDYNNDQYPDLLLWDYYENTLYLYENSGGSSLDVAWSSTVEYAYYGKVGTADFNNDGFIDFYFRDGSYGSPQIRIYINDSGNGFLEIPELIEAGVEPIKPVDLNHDGRMDLVCEESRFLTGFINEMVETVPAFSWKLDLIPDTQIYDDINLLEDLNNDGRYDIISLNTWGDTRTLLQTESSAFTNIDEEMPFYDLDDSIEFLFVDDFNGDGWKDFFYIFDQWDPATPNEAIQLFLCKWNPLANEYETVLLPIAYFDIESVDYCDIDNDGDFDFFIVGSLYEEDNTRCFLVNNGSGVFTKTAISTMRFDFSELDRFCDFNRDGDIDWILVDYRGIGIYWNILNPGNETPSIPANLHVDSGDSTFTFSWDISADLETPSPLLRYRLRAGHTSGSMELVSPTNVMEDLIPVFDENTGEVTGYEFNICPYYGPPGDYYWSVEAIDLMGAGSGFAEEQIFHISEEALADVTSVQFTLEGIENKVTLRWNSVIGAKYYEVWRGLEDNIESAVKISDDSIQIATPFVDPTLPPESTYYYWVRSANDTEIGSYSHSIKVTTLQGLDHFSPVDTGFGTIVSCEFGDFDSDGDLDCVVVGSSESYSTLVGDQLKVYVNNGNNEFTETWSLLAPNNVFFMYAYWIPDLVRGGLNFSLITRTQVEDEKYVAPVNVFSIDTYSVDSVAWILSDRVEVFDSKLLRTYDFQFKDGDNDGDTDILVYGQADEQADGFTYEIWWNKSGCYNAILLDQLRSEAWDVELIWEDFDGDSLLDILAFSGDSYNYQRADLYFQKNPLRKYFDDYLQIFDIDLRSINLSDSYCLDIDEDGDLDILLTNDESNPQSTVYRNDGYGVFTLDELTVNGVPEFNLFDLNRDGHLDLVVNLEEFLVYYPNNKGILGEPVYVFNEIAMGVETYRFGPEINDYDGDGDWDFLYQDYTSFGILNTQSSATPFSQNPLKPTIWISYMSDDIVSFAWNSGIDTETPPETLSYYLIIGTNYGEMDILPKAINVETGESLTGHCEGSITGTFWDFDYSNLAAGGYYWSVQTVDNDGHSSELADFGYFSISPEEAYIPQWVGVSQGDFTDKIELKWVWDTASVLAYEVLIATEEEPDYPSTFLVLNDDVEISIDGIATMTIGSIPPGEKFYYRLNALFSEISPSRLSTVRMGYTSSFQDVTTDTIDKQYNWAGWARAQWVDLRGDGDLDIVVNSFDGNNYYSGVYQQQWHRHFQLSSLDLMKEVIGGMFEWGDIDGNGMLDCLIAGNTTAGGWNSKEMGLYLNWGYSGFEEVVGNDFEPMAVGDGVWCDFDNDGDLDIAYAGDNYVDSKPDPLHLYENLGEGNFQSRTDATICAPIWGHVETLNFNGDSYMDIAVTGIEGDPQTNSPSRIYVNRGDFNFELAWEFPDLGLNRGTWLVGDFDGDGNDDFFYSGKNGSYENLIAKTCIYRNDGNGGFIEISLDYLPVLERSNGDCGDYDGDGDLDIVYCGIDASDKKPKTILLNNGGVGHFSIDDSAIIAGVNNWPAVDFGDYDNDGDLDILLCGEFSAVPPLRIYQNNLESGGNERPSQPENLNGSYSDNSFTISWDKAFDDSTPQDSLTYSVVIQNRRLGWDALPLFTSEHYGRVIIPTTGNVGRQTEWSFNTESWPPGRYYYSVVAVDNSYRVSDFDYYFMPYFDIGPDIPRNLTLESDNTVYSVSLSWDIVADAEGYFIVRSEYGNIPEFNGWSNLNTQTAFFTDNTVLPGTPYYYWVWAYIEPDICSQASEPVTGYLYSPVDSDGDGLPDLMEYWLGEDPQTASSQLELIDMRYADKRWRFKIPLSDYPNSIQVEPEVSFYLWDWIPAHYYSDIFINEMDDGGREMELVFPEWSPDHIFFRLRLVDPLEE